MRTAAGAPSTTRIIFEFLNNIPFADHNAMLDPSTADVTARAIECLGQMGWSCDASGNPTRVAHF